MTDITRAPLPQRLLSACLAVWVAGALFAPATRADMPPRNEVPAVAIHRIQQPQDASDASPYAGETVSTEGIVVARDSIGYVLSETPSGPYIARNMAGFNFPIPCSADTVPPIATTSRAHSS